MAVISKNRLPLCCTFCSSANSHSGGDSCTVGEFEGATYNSHKNDQEHQKDNHTIEETTCKNKNKHKKSVYTERAIVERFIVVARPLTKFDPRFESRWCRHGEGSSR